MRVLVNNEKDKRKTENHMKNFCKCWGYKFKNCSDFMFWWLWLIELNSEYHKKEMENFCKIYGFTSLQENQGNHSSKTSWKMFLFFFCIGHLIIWLKNQIFFCTSLVFPIKKVCWNNFPLFILAGLWLFLCVCVCVSLLIIFFSRFYWIKVQYLIIIFIAVIAAIVNII